MTKVDIISGFLGAGKTTLIKKLLEDGLNKEKVVLIENEYGEVGIDGGFLKDAGIEITEMNSGCICCTLVGDFVTSIAKIMEDYSPDRIIIEPSGVGKLSDVMAAVIDMEKDHDLKLDSLVTVVNALKFKKQQKAFAEFFSNQVEHATTVIMSRTQGADENVVEDCMKMIRKLNENAAVITTPWDEITGEKILSVMEGRDNLKMKAMAMEHHLHDQEAHAGHHHDHDHGHHHHGDHDHDHEHHHHGDHEHEHEHHHHGDHEHEHEHHHHGDHEHEHEHHHHGDHEHEHEHHHHGDHEHEHEHHHHHGHHDHEHEHHHEGHHHADEIFDTWGRETAIKISRETVEAAMAEFAREDGSYGDVLRSKGMVDTGAGWVYFDYVEGEYELREGEPDYTGRLVVIGADLNEHKIEELFGLE